MELFAAGPPSAENQIWPSRKTGRHRLLVVLLCTMAAAAFQRGELRAHGASHELIERVSLEIAARPEDGSLYLRRAALHLGHGDWRACLLDVDEAERRQTQPSEAGLIRGRALAAGGRLAEAKTTLDAFLAAHPKHSTALLERARVSAALGEKAEAAERFVRAMAQIAQPEPDQIIELAALLCFAGREAEGLAAIDRSLLATPGVPSLVECGVKIEIDLGRFEDALRRIEEASKGAGRKEPWMARRAAVLAQAGRIVDSLAAWRELQARLAALPAAERDSHAMLMLSERTRHAMSALISIRP